MELSFLTLADIELKRAERYRIFVSLIVIDFSRTRQIHENCTQEKLAELALFTSGKVRACDTVTALGDCRLAILFPETARQGAESAARRLGDLVKRHIADKLSVGTDEVIPMEIASYPDAAGARTIANFLEELVQKSRN